MEQGVLAKERERGREREKQLKLAKYSILNVRGEDQSIV
jgi:hypothetical protein